jgi:hypothetical protein
MLHSTGLKSTLEKSNILVCYNGQLPSQPKRLASVRHSRVIFSITVIDPLSAVKDSLPDKPVSLLSLS